MQGLDHKEDHRQELQGTAGEHPHMEDAVHIANLLEHVKRRAGGVAQPARGEQDERRGMQQLEQLRQAKDHEPTHDQVHRDGKPTRLALAHKDLEQDARHGERPHGDAQRNAARVRERDEAKRRVGAGDEHVDAAMVDDAEHALGGGHRDGVVERGGEILQDECDAKDDGADKRGGVGSRNGRLDDHDDERRNREPRADAMRDGVGDLLAERILRALVIAHRAGRGLDRSRRRGDGRARTRARRLQQALGARRRIGAHYGNRGSRDVRSRRWTVARVRHVFRLILQK